MRSAIVYLLNATILLTPIGVLSQRPATPAKPPVTAPIAAQSLLKLEPSRRSQFLSASWDSGVLPAPMRPVAVQFEDKEGQIFMMNAQQGKAEAYAKAINAGDQNSMPAVVGALMQAGYGIQTSDGAVQKWSGGQGMNIPAYLIAAMAKQHGQGQSISLQSFVKGFTKTMQPFRDIAFQDLLLAGMREAESSKVPETVFWAELIAELGKHSASPYDIFDAGIDVNRIRLDPIQRQLILLRLAGDLTVAQHARTGRQPGRENFRNASYRVEKTSRSAKNTPAIADSPCVFSNMGGVLSDETALVITQVFSRLASAADGIMAMVGGTTRIGDYLRISGAGTILLNILKFIATYAALEIKLSMDSPTLVRTKTRAPGERKQLTATVKVNTGKWAELATCARPLLNLIGLDFSLPNDGAVSNAKINFVLQENEDTGGVEAIMHNGNAGNFFGDAGTTYSEPIGGVRIEPVSQQAQYTDEKGIARVSVIGEPQNEDLSHLKLTAVQRRVGIAAFIQMKATDPQNLAADPSRTTGTVMDYLGPIVSLLTGDELGAAVGAVTETLYRTAWYSSDVFPITVKDWKSCGECWAGTFSMTTTTSEAVNETKNGRTTVRNYSKTTEVTIRVTVDKDGIATTTATVSENAAVTTDENGTDICHIAINAEKTTAPWTTSKHVTDTTTGSVTAYASISVDGANVRISATTDPVAQKISVEDKQTNGCYTDRLNGSNTTNYNLTQKFNIDISGKGDPTRPNTAHGTQTVRNPTGSTTYKWDLERQ